MKKIQRFSCAALFVFVFSMFTGCESRTPVENGAIESTVGDISTSGQGEASSAEKSIITSDEAKIAALNDAGLKEDEVNFKKIELEYEDGILVYEIEFFTSDAEYEYEIRADDGTIFKKENECSSHHTSVSSEEIKIDLETAKKIALEHANLSIDAVSFHKTKLENKHGEEVYKIEFIYNGREYEYKISASDGAILEYEKG